MRLLLALVGSSLVSLTLACSSSTTTPTPGEQNENDGGVSDTDAGGACVDVLPASCPSPEPSYAKDVEPILASRCYACHSGSGITSSGSGIDLGSYAAVFPLRGDVSTEVNGCRMPPVTSPQTTNAERTTLLAWVKCNAPNN